MEEIQKYERNVNTFDELVRRNVSYIKGELRASPYRGTSVSSDAFEKSEPFFEEQLKKIIEIN